MRNTLIVLFLTFLLININTFSQSGNNLNTNSIQVAFPLSDDAEDTTASYAKWSRDASQWQIKIVGAHSGSQAWVLQKGPGEVSGYTYITLSSGMDLSSTPNPYIQCWVKRSDGQGGYISLQASSDGGTTWNNLIVPSFNGSNYSRIQASLYNYRVNNALVRIGCYAPYSSYYLDDIIIDNAPTPQSFVLLNQTNNGMEVKWGQSTASDFDIYRVVLSTDQNKLTNDLNNFDGNKGYYVTTDINNRTENVVFDISKKATTDTVLTDLTFTNTTYYGKIYERDTQGLINQGSDRADLATTFTVTAETAPFTETFEGSFKWAADEPWAVTTDDASDAGHSTTHAYEDSPGGNYPPNANRILAAQINFGNMQHPVLRFNQKYSYEQNSDQGYLEFSTNNSNWTKITSFTGNTGGLWETRDFDAGMLKGTSGYVRFRTHSNGAGIQQDGWHLDDIQVFNNTRTTSFPFFDDVSVDTASQKKWIPGAWSVKIAGDHSGDSQVWYLPQSDGGPDGYDYITLGGPINLSGTSNPYVQFWIKRSDNQGGYVRVQASNDGGVTWTTLINPNFTGAQYSRIQASLYNFRESSIMIRIGGYAPYNSYYLDDIMIDNAPTPKSFVLLNPTNNGMEVKWGKSTAADFGFYRLVVTTDQNVLTNDYNNSAANKGYYAVTDVNRRTETRVFDISNINTTDTILTDLTFTNAQYYGKIYEQDTQLLINQGSDRADLATTFDVSPEVAPFTEDFEGSSFKWAADIPWAVTQADSSDTLHSPTHAFEDSPNGNYDANADRRLVVQMNLSSITRPLLMFNHKYAFEQNNDFGSIDISSDNAKWSNIASFTGNSGGVWETEEFDLGPLSQQSTAYLRFNTTSNGASVQQDGWHLDDIQVTDNYKHAQIPFIDSVEVDSVSRTYWTTGVWKINSANAHSGTQVWYCPQSGGGTDGYTFLTLKGTVDLSAAPKPYVSFWVRRGDGSGGYCSFEVSSDGGQTWKVIQRPNFNGTAYTQKLYSLADYRQNNVLIRIGVYSPYGTYYLDDIEIADSTGYATGISDFAGIIPENYELSQNYPNPFNPTTTIRYALPAESKVILTVYNLLGQRIAELVDEVQSSGYHEKLFNAANLASGVYLYSLTAVSSDGTKNFSVTKKLVLLK